MITQLIDYAGAEYRGHLNNRVEEEKKNLCNLQAETQYYHRAGRRWGEKKGEEDNEAILLCWLTTRSFFFIPLHSK